jgi:hypothetical protein
LVLVGDTAVTAVYRFLDEDNLPWFFEEQRTFSNSGIDLGVRATPFYPAPEESLL